MIAAAVGPVVAAMSALRRPWWVIGSAAVVLHGAPTSVADIDVLCGSEDDARAVISALGGEILVGTGTDLFRSTVFGRCSAIPLPVEVMAGLSVRGEPVRLTTREWRHDDDVQVPVPSRAELIALLRRFGRPKDLARAALLEA